MHRTTFGKKAVGHFKRLREVFLRPGRRPNLEESLAALSINSLFELEIIVSEATILISRWPRECCDQMDHGKVGPVFQLAYEGLYITYELCDGDLECRVHAISEHKHDCEIDWEINSSELEFVRTPPRY